jgi:TfoX/Sxy family transcriptional regulator of competence genes
MAYNEKLAERTRIALATQKNVEEKKMMGGLTFMVNGKMCVGILKDELMCRIDPDVHDDALKRKGCRVMDFTGKPMKGYVLINDEGLKNQKEFDSWIALSLEFNKKAKAAKKKN